MDSKVQQVVKETILNLHKKGIPATPSEYQKEFCEISKVYDFSVQECEVFKKFVEKLSKNEQIEIKNKEIATFEDLIPILLNRVSKENLDSLAKLFQQSITPSISIDIDEDLHKFSVKIGNSPALMFEDDIQKEMQNFITKRFEADKKVVKEKTAEIAKMLTLMGQYFSDAIQSSGNGSKEVSNIKSEIQSMDMQAPNIETLTNLQSKLISAAKSIENEMSNVGEKLSSGKSEVETLEQKVIQLQEELEKTRQESIKDHLTGLLTRRAYDDAIKRIENNFIRNNTQYAIVFFDLDHFKKINDSFGHEAGDVVLSTFAKVLGKNTRDLDVVSRYGGEEFVAIVHFNLKRELLKYLKRIKSIIQENNFLYKNNKIHVTFSAGVAIRNNHSSYDSTIQKSDMLLYQAKESGRNKIILEDGTVI
ncbi:MULTISPECIES: GGDEF domain-containing protein [Arcobacteraceae]|jgi:diguanylate cyclase (GGDEF)-like protein|uniref:diguanylate cyclase n=2 Tax=Arcobacteraceae TaxID=2808963 RepID=A0A4Q0Y487_9BACT|nr:MULTISPECIES: GGDEF domain-containing protein [Arcobacteraceae]PPK57885.1 diguanylate cyclase (GGDEF)-like protein [Malaciobacter marinus]QDF29346.1 diguanylate cyclase [Halarcobacter anaerophilus]RXJ64593.1 GGDEF domain-containing protein [Halarcobacter anaerophilus]